MAINNQSNDMKDDDLSKKICFRCQEAAIVCWEFHETVLNSERQILELLKSKEAPEVHEEAETDNEVDDDETGDYEFLFDNEEATAAETEAAIICEDLSEHERFEFDETSFPETEIRCGIYEETLLDDNDLECHTRLQSPSKDELFSCNVCGEDFTSYVQLSFHHSQNHESVENLDEATAKDDQFSQQKKEKRPYRKDNQGRFICHVCERTYSTRDTLGRHLVKHTSTKDFKCNFCPREFFFQRDLNVHLKQQHFDPKKFKCEICTSEFMSNSAMKKHLSMHFEKSKRMFDCDKCDLSFKTKGVLQNHYRTHTGDKPFVCQICPNGTAFTQKIILQRHMKNIHREKIYQCEWCNDSFEMHGQLRDHWKECTNLRSRGNYEIVINSNEDIVMNCDDQNETAVRSIEVDFDED